MRHHVVNLALAGLFLLGVLGCHKTGDVFSKPSSSGAGGSSNSGGTSNLGGAGGGTNLFVGTVTSLAAGDAHTCFVSKGALFCFGDGEAGALGTGSADDELIPRRVDLGVEIDVVSAGARTTCVLTVAGLVECTGAGNTGQLGRGTFESSSTFDVVQLPAPAASVDVGADHTCAILESGELYCWGSNAEGQLGQPDPFPGPGTPRPAPILVDPSARYKKVSLGQGHTCGVRTDGALYCWGRNSDNQLGQGDAYADQARDPVQVGLGTDYETVRSGQGHTCATRGSGTLECWGIGEAGQLGLGARGARDVPTAISGVLAAALELDTFHTCVLSNGDFLCSGRGQEGALGTGTTDQLKFSKVPIAGVRLFAVGRFHTCAATAMGLSCTGENGDGRLGVGDRERRSELTPVVTAL